MNMDTNNWNIKYVIGNVVIAVVVVWWASLLVKLAGSPFETFYTCRCCKANNRFRDKISEDKEGIRRLAVASQG